MSDSIMEIKNYRTVKVPPEGGFGYLVAIGMSMPFIFALSSMPSFGLMFNDFLLGLGEETSAVTIITSTFFCAFSFAGLFTNTLFKKMSIRKVGIFGATMYFVGSLMTIFVTSVEQLMISFSIFQGAGFGFMIPVAYTTFNLYFVNKRVVMMSVAQSLIGVGTMLYPIMVQFFMDKYGFRGTMAMVAALNGHVIFGMIVMHPIEWHYKVYKVRIDEDLPLMNTNKPEVRIVVLSENDCELKPQIDIENEIPSDQQTQNEINAELVKSQRSKSLDPTQILDGFDPTQRRVSSISSLGNWTGAVIVSEALKPTKKNGKWQKVVDFLDLTLFNDLIYVNIALGCGFALYSDTAFFTLQPMYLFELGFSKTDASVIIAIGAAADLGSRIFMAVMSLCIQVKARHIYLAGAVLTIVTRFTLMGFFRTWIHVPLPLVFADHLSQERFPSGYGLFMMLSGNITFLFGPFVGWIRDITSSYIVCFHSLTFVMAMCAVPWIIEFICLYIYRRKIEN
ncbi:uncharacterized protein LOC116342706 isoform X2 [Contarinia nasturtii]|uniref:uncharacterized protein LOC116342706 isoform X2 n=1 Tax=Contarinia nasturtii TaxID=265458 RepID=UPI0012D4A06F|nr:uncharacterized protein LOC116342706 isoform X2 [Contarinia nasturtii]